jgi:polar amino acid transport system substrate-binding protein
MPAVPDPVQSPRERFRIAPVVILGAALCFIAVVGFASDRAPAGGNAGPATEDIPVLWDSARRPDKPDLSRLTGIRFLTETDFPPFNYAGPDGNPVGFNVDLARLVCAELGLRCTIQMRRFDTLIDSLVDGRGDAVIASVRPTAALRQRVDFTDPYYRSPARFVARKPVPADVRPAGRRVAVVAGSAHEAFLATFFPDAVRVPSADLPAARTALREGAVDLLFADGILAALWLNGTDSAGCCTFVDGPYLESRYFGEGLAIQVRRGDDTLRRALNWGLFRIWEKGDFAELWLKYFPVNPYAGLAAR